jgi:hypothetical protein
MKPGALRFHKHQLSRRWQLLPQVREKNSVAKWFEYHVLRLTTWHCIDRTTGRQKSSIGRFFIDYAIGNCIAAKQSFVSPPIGDLIG